MKLSQNAVRFVSRLFWLFPCIFVEIRYLLVKPTYLRLVGSQMVSTLIEFVLLSSLFQVFRSGFHRYRYTKSWARLVPKIFPHLARSWCLSDRVPLNMCPTTMTPPWMPQPMQQLLFTFGPQQAEPKWGNEVGSLWLTWLCGIRTFSP